MNTVEQVIQHLKKGELTEALKHINRIKSSESAEDILLLAEEMLQLGFAEEAKDLFEHLLELYPDEGELIVSLAEILIDMDQEDEAMLMLEKVSADDEVYPSALLLEADLYQLQGMDEVSERKLLQAKEMLPDEIIIDFALAELFFHQGRDQEAIANYIKVLEQEQEIAGVNVNQRLAEALSSSGKFEEALPHFEKALKDGLEINTLFEYAFTAFQAGLYETAVRKFIELKELDHEYHSLYLYLAKSYEHLEDLEKALKTVKEGIKADEFNKELYFFGGKIALKSGLDEEAENLFKEALAIDPGYLEAALTLLKLYMHNERYEDVLECIGEVRRYGEDDPQFEWIAAVSYQHTEQFKESLTSYHKAYNSFKDNQDFLEDYGFFLIEEGDRATSREVFNKLLEMNPANDEYAMILERLSESTDEM
ncbi:tetratricopeptide repeat protein [Peribacillus simplex]|uniref:Tetratricopeptide repeat protein n=2 Tax=Peribacillus TaxID=2675229 RepID=A0AA90PCI9_9BACI|nr:MULTISPECIES: tetratricopeptide repeat protein [Peribacillus]MDP1418773.1 tetratricopeptide repeat protein [Peribacillus simplex]MDP1450827.1 tetratricopeptide repeat protein [Peribacillus frigoritolerans]